MNENDQPFRVNSKVRVRNFPLSSGAATFNYNGLVGVVKRAERVGFASTENRSVYAYEVFFENVNVPYAIKNEATGKFDKGVKKGNAQNYFEEIFS